GLQQENAADDNAADCECAWRVANTHVGGIADRQVTPRPYGKRAERDEEQTGQVLLLKAHCRSILTFCAGSCSPPARRFTSWRVPLPRRVRRRACSPPRR